MLSFNILSSYEHKEFFKSMEADFLQNKILLRTDNLNFRVAFQRLFGVSVLLAFALILARFVNHQDHGEIFFFFPLKASVNTPILCSL